MKYVFGPVPSRRLGRSLGIDLVPFKTCTYDCIYCQLGRTTHLTTERREWVSLDDVLAEVKAMCPTRPDYITLSGSGEPTLYSRLDELIDRIGAMTDIPVAVLTNGSLLWDETVRAQISHASLVIPSLDAGDPDTFVEVNRPCDGIDFDRMLDGLITFGKGYDGVCWLEVLLVAGRNSTDGQMARIAELVRQIGPDRVQLNTATRPTTEANVTAVEPGRLAELARRFDPPAEVIADYRHVPSRQRPQGGQVAELLSRRPCTLDDLAEGLGMHRHQILKHVEQLRAEGRIVLQMRGGRLYYAIDPMADAGSADVDFTPTWP
jgi:wyosine [tRNA(Phe)-imidazoG37] synthetase (radical SAM superfamily)